jgi:hypothetical protein
MSENRNVASELKRGSTRREQLPPSLVARVDYVRVSLREVYPQAMAHWLNSFRRGADPESEIRWWEQLTQWYRTYNDTRKLNAEQQQALFTILFQAAMGSNFHGVEAEVDTLPENALHEILAIVHQQLQ